MTGYLAISRFADTDVPLGLRDTFEAARELAWDTTPEEAAKVAEYILKDTVSGHVTNAVVSFYDGYPTGLTVFEPRGKPITLTVAPDPEPWIIKFPGPRKQGRA